MSSYETLCGALQRLGGPQVIAETDPSMPVPLLQCSPSPSRQAVAERLRRDVDVNAATGRSPSAQKIAASLPGAGNEGWEERDVGGNLPNVQNGTSWTPVPGAADHSSSEPLTGATAVMPTQKGERRRHLLRFFHAHCPRDPSVANRDRGAEGVAEATSSRAYSMSRAPPDGIDLKLHYFQVVKEVVTVCTGRKLYQHLLSEVSMSDTCSTLPRPSFCAAEPMVGSAKLSLRHVTLRTGVLRYLCAVARAEAATAALSTTCQAYLDRSESQASPVHLFFAQLPHVPIQRWAGTHLYNNWFVHVCAAAPSAEVSASTNDDAHRLNRRAIAPLAAPESTPPFSLHPRPKALLLPNDVELELQKYWKLHREAAARARMEALRSHDTEAFAAHVSLLKVSALLEIMEKTEAFMHRIGLRLQAQGNVVTASEAPKKDVTHALCGSPPAPLPESEDHTVLRRASDSRSSAYDRFRAYVASTKSDFKLTHRLDVFVETQPTGLQATLLPHQMDGLRFLASLDANHINGILADEMGVGKTIQTLAFLLYLKHKMSSRLAAPERSRGVAPAAVVSHRPHLVLAPLSVVREWVEACEQFVPQSLRVTLYSSLNDPVKEAAAYDLLLLPVHAIRRVAAEAARIPWHYIVVDEAHKAVANLTTATAQCIVDLPCLRRLVLTGTPLSSDLQELWSLLYFLNPHVFTDHDAFEEVFRRPFRLYGATREMELTEEERGLLILRLHQVLRPFLLRRTKADIDASLRITFHHVWCPLSLVQQRMLALLRERRRTPAILHVEESESSSASEQSAEAVGAALKIVDSDVTLGKPSAAEGSDQGGRLRLTGIPTMPAAAAISHNEEHQRCSSVGGTNALEEEVGDALTDLAQRYFPSLVSGELEKALCHAITANKTLGLSSANTSTTAAQLLCHHAFLLPFFSQVLHQHGLDEAITEDAGDGRAILVEGGGRRGAARAALSCSGKFLFIHLLLSRLYVARRKVVLFTHWLDCISLLSEYLESRGWSSHAEMLTGGSSEAERRRGVQRFRDDPSCLFFILSIKAGGCGINLQSAHMVVLLDRDYTATNEDQALARVYRIGQRHTVRALFCATDDASERRVAERATEKNKPRQAIIDDGVYQVSTNDKAEEASVEVDEADARPKTALRPCEPSSTESLGSTAAREMWSRVHAAAIVPAIPATFSLPTAEDAPGERKASVAAAARANDELSSDASFWAALGSLVSALDALVLTDEDRTVAAAAQEALAEGSLPRPTSSSPSTKETAGPQTGRQCTALDSAMERLRVTRPPQSAVRLQQALEHHCHVETKPPHGGSGCSPQSPVKEVDDTAAATERWEEEEKLAAADAAPSRKECSSPSPQDSLFGPVGPASQAIPCPSGAVPDPFCDSALFWLEYAYLLRMARCGPDFLVTALDTAVQNDAARDDSAAQLRRRQRRDARAAKRLRLATVDVPDSFREKCWADEGVDDEAEIAERYLRLLDTRAEQARQRRRKESV